MHQGLDEDTLRSPLRLKAGDIFYRESLRFRARQCIPPRTLCRDMQ
jgi:hypothetical protein